MTDKWQWLHFTWCKALFIPCKADFHWSCEAPDQFTKLYNMISCKKTSSAFTVYLGRQEYGCTFNNKRFSWHSFNLYHTLFGCHLHSLDMPCIWVRTIPFEILRGDEKSGRFCEKLKKKRCRVCKEKKICGEGVTKKWASVASVHVAAKNMWGGVNNFFHYAPFRISNRIVLGTTWGI